ncbi:hypothetical protein BET10_20265 [Pseudoalteromonas amylolytica]|uniref:Uncharacterized protein n=1 Tax=Pseudoalteromonas amylolytica TaxID=1859457 RepID=A0A1S1MSE1_9GAMM|nr:hypothetical protein BFC16_18130 [Pseudoalteromonas sp. JW3]OHU87284.1 hypothetical protein BET10_20265 [Pseudoalteromonas amylolytica]
MFKTPINDKLVTHLTTKSIFFAQQKCVLVIKSSLISKTAPIISDFSKALILLSKNNYIKNIEMLGGHYFHSVDTLLKY